MMVRFIIGNIESDEELVDGKYTICVGLCMRWFKMSYCIVGGSKKKFKQ